MKNRKLIVCIAIIILATACGQEPEQPPASQTASLTVAAYEGDSTALVYVAQEKGFFLKHGLEVTIKGYEAGKLAADALLRGEADVATATGAVFAGNYPDYPDLKAFGTVALGQTNDVVARRDRGIESPSDLKGKRIGVTRKSSGEFFLGMFLNLNGIRLEDVILVDLTPAQIVEAMADGRIDAAITWDPNVFHIVRKMGDAVYRWPAQSGQAFHFILMTTSGRIEKGSDKISRLVEALLEAERYAEDNPEEVKKFIAKRFGLSPEYVDYIWKKHTYEVILPQSLVVALEEMARWRIQRKLKIPQCRTF